MAYAEVGDVLARAGRLSTAWDDETTPSLTDLERFLGQAADTLDAALASLGIGIPLTDALAIRALLPLNADMALLTAIDATWPGGRGGDDVKEARDGAKDRVDRALAAFVDEKRRYPVVAYLLGLLEGGDVVHDALNFWDEESDYGVLGSSSVAEAATVSPYVLPGFQRGMKL